MNMIQQQIEQMISSGELENMLMEFLSSGTLEQMMQMPSEEQMAEMEQGWMEMMSSMGMDPAQMEQAWAEWEAQMETEWNANGGLMGMLGMTGEDLQMMMQMMEMKSHCKCTSSDVAYGEMAMPTMPMAADKK